MIRLLRLTLILASAAGVVFAGAPPAPEIDGSTGVAALGLLGGGILILRSRKKK